MKLCGGIDLHSNNSVLVLIQPAHCGVVRDRGRLQDLAVGGLTMVRRACQMQCDNKRPDPLLPTREMKSATD